MRWLGRGAMAVGLGIATTVALAWLAALQTQRGLKVLPMMTFRERDPARGEGEGWLRVHTEYKPGWRRTMGQVVTPLQQWSPSQVAPEQIIHGRVRRQAAPWLDGLRPWPGAGRGEYFALFDYGWPCYALYFRRSG